MHVTWWIPGTLAGTANPCYRLPTTWGGPYRSEAALLGRGPVVLRRLLVHPAPDLAGEGLRELLLDVRDKANCTRDYRKATAYLPGEIELSQDGADGAGRVDRQVAAVGPGCLIRDDVHELDVPPGQPVVGGDCEQAGRARIGRLVDGMPESRDGLLRSLMAGNDVARDVAQVGIGCRGRKRLLERLCSFFDRATETRSHPKDSGCHRPLQRLRRAEVG